ncbi:MAG: head GIN domain-containing protein, partial [Bacteroidota bacterium]
VQHFESRGKTRQYAIENAKNIVYQYNIENANLSFAPNFTLKNNTPYRGQQVDMKLYIPYNKEFTLSESLRDVLSDRSLKSEGYSFHNLGDRNVWIYNENGLNCLTCEEKKSTLTNTDSDADKVDFSFEEGDFEKVKVTGAFDVEIVRADKYSLQAHGENKDLKRLKVEVKNNTLTIRHKARENIKRGSSESLRVTIKVPKLSEMHAEGALKCKISRLENEAMRIKLVGAVSCEADVDIEHLTVEVTGASNLKLKGKGDHFNLGVMGTSEVDANAFIADNITVEALGISNAIVHAADILAINASPTSSVKYNGEPDQLNIMEITDDNKNYQFNF